MLNKNTLGVKKVRGQSEATCKQAGATKILAISGYKSHEIIIINKLNKMK